MKNPLRRLFARTPVVDPLQATVHDLLAIRAARDRQSVDDAEAALARARHAAHVACREAIDGLGCMGQAVASLRLVERCEAEVKQARGRVE